MKKNKGFTLIEVLIALCIIAIALAAAVQATTQSTRATAHLRQTITAHWIGLNVLSQIQTGLIVMPNSDELPPGKTEMLGKTWTWTANATVSEALPTVRKITVTVSYEDHVVNTVTGYAQI